MRGLAALLRSLPALAVGGGLAGRMECAFEGCGPGPDHLASHLHRSTIAGLLCESSNVHGQAARDRQYWFTKMLSVMKWLLAGAFCLRFCGATAEFDD